MSGYDAKHLLRQIGGNLHIPGQLHLITKNKERFISFTEYLHGTPFNFCFIDWFRFMSHSLDRLASYLEEKPILIREFLKDRYSAEQIRLLEAKGFYPYEHTDSFETLQKTDFSPQEAFCSSLTESSISSEDYQ